MHMARIVWIIINESSKCRLLFLDILAGHLGHGTRMLDIIRSHSMIVHSCSINKIFYTVPLIDTPCFGLRSLSTKSTEIVVKILTSTNQRNFTYDTDVWVSMLTIWGRK